jgi:hypothetical protein
MLNPFKQFQSRYKAAFDYKMRFEIAKCQLKHEVNSCSDCAVKCTLRKYAD